MKYVPVVFLASFAFLAVACGHEGDACEGAHESSADAHDYCHFIETCEVAQDMDCTGFGGDCADFARASSRIASKAGCETEFKALAECGASADACSLDAQCTAEGAALADCTDGFCAANSSDQDCRDLPAWML